MLGNMMLGLMFLYANQAQKLDILNQKNMKKPFKFTETDNTRRCETCGEPLKKNLLAKDPNAKECYQCVEIGAKRNPRNQKELSKLKAKQSRRKTANSIFLTCVLAFILLLASCAPQHHMVKCPDHKSKVPFTVWLYNWQIK